MSCRYGLLDANDLADGRKILFLFGVCFLFVKLKASHCKIFGWIGIADVREVAFLFGVCFVFVK